MNDKIGFHARSSSDSFLVLGPGGLAASKSAEITDNRPSNEVSAAMQKAEGELKHFDEEAEDKQQQQQEEAEPLLERFRKDATYQQFLRSDFNPISYAGAVLKASDTSTAALPSALAKISSGIQALNKELKAQAASQHEELFKQVNTVKELETMLQGVNLGVDSLQNAIISIRAELTEPFMLIQSRTMQLERAQMSCDMLRKIMRFLYVSKKLHSHMDTQRLPEAAECFFELEQIRRSADLSGIHVIDKETQWILKAGEEIVSGASLMLMQGMETQNQAQVANSLKVFFNLQQLGQRLEATVAGLITKISQTTKTLLADELRDGPQGSIRRSGAVPTPPSNQAKWRAALWTRMERLTDTFHSCAVQMWHLQRVLTRIKSHTPLMELQVGSDDIYASFWKTMAQILQDELVVASRNSTFVDNALVSEYPKLLRLFSDFLKRLRTHTEVKHIKEDTRESIINEQRASHEQLLIAALSKFEQDYLARSLSRLFEPINLLFSSGRAPPSPDDVANLAKCITSELEMSRMDERLNASVARGVAKALKFFAVKTENSIATDSEAYQVSEPINPAQKRNAMAFNGLFHLHSSVTAILHTIPPQAMEYIEDAMKQLARVGQQIITPMFSRITASLEATLLGIHHEGYGGSKHKDSVHACSAYMEKLQKQLQHFHTNILGHFVSCPAINVRVRALASRVVIFFARHASLVRPLSQIGTMKLAGDMAQLEMALAPIQSLKDLGGPYKELRALRPLLFRENDQILGSPELSSLSLCTVMHHMFSRAPEELLSPHVRAGWSIAKYSKWLDENSEVEAWKLMKASLDAYAQKVNSRGDSAFHPIYPIMLSLANYFFERFQDTTTTATNINA